MEFLEFCMEVLGMICIVFGVISFARNLMSSGYHSFGVAIGLIVIGGGALVLPTVLPLSSVIDEQQERVVMDDTITYLGIRNETEKHWNVSFGAAIINGKVIPASGAVPGYDEETYLYFEYNGEEVKVDDIPQLYFQCQDMEYGDTLSCEVSVVDEDGNRDMSTAKVVSINGVSID